MRRALSLLAVLALSLAALPAGATHHTFVIESLYSNADGSVQYVVLHETQNQTGQRMFLGQSLTATHGATTRSFPFPGNLPSSATQGRRVLIATPGFAALGLIAPDYVLPERFLATDGGTLAYGGVDSIPYPPLPSDGATAVDRNGASVPAIATNFAGAAVALRALPVGAVEFHNASLDHYFISDLAPDLDALDSGRIAGWARTGLSFLVHPSQASGGPGVNPVCRFYIPPQHGNSHFFSASPAECTTIQQKTLTDPNFSGYVYESPNAFYIALPNTTTGACPAGTLAVYRLWNNRADSNHRYTADVAVKAQMLSSAYVAEGYGPNATIMCAPTPGTAFVQFAGGSGAANGVLVSDGASTATANYQAYATATDTVGVGPRAGAGEAIAFSARRAVSVQPATWSTAAGNQTLPVPLGSELSLPVTIWIVAGPFAANQQTALTLWQTAQQMFQDERLGVSLAPLEIVDATANVQAAAWNAYTCGPGTVAALQSAIGQRPGRINVYLVNLVDGSPSRGNACAIGGDFLAIAAGASADLLAHEIGHDLGLEHIDDLVAEFTDTNVMHSQSSVRQYVTEGQTFRAHLRPNSAINAVYNARGGLPVRGCDRDTLTLQCPAIHKRAWADGTLPAN
jgi:hypothetical protein